MRRRGGFTFLEITIVVLIVMVLSVVAFPRMKSTMQHMRLRQGARDLAAVMRLARDSAVVRGAPVQVVMSTDNKKADKYQIELLDKNMELLKVETRRSWHDKDDDRYAIPGKEALRIRDLPDGVFFGRVTSSAPMTESDLPCIMFYPDGSATAATIMLQDTRDKTMNVEVYRATGLSHIMPGDKPVKVKQRLLFMHGTKK